MISRIWHGWTTPENADRYESLLKEEIFVGIQNRRIPGFKSIQLLRREVGAEVEAAVAGRPAHAGAVAIDAPGARQHRVIGRIGERRVQSVGVDEVERTRARPMDLVNDVVHGRFDRLVYDRQAKETESPHAFPQSALSLIFTYRRLD